MPPRPARILLISSGGGHWVELLRLREAFAGHELVWATVDPRCREEVDGRFWTVPDATRWDRFRLLWCLLKVAWILIRERPDFVVTTGAAPGLFAIALGKWFGARTVWIDSIANAEELSLSGARAGRYADLWLTQWPHLARPGGPSYAGSVL